jgi:ERCC4 domain
VVRSAGVDQEFVVARNPEEGSKLPYLLILPLGSRGIVLKSREMWPRTAKVYCHEAYEIPDQLEILERVGVRTCVRRGAAIDLVLDRGRENRSQFVFAKARGRDVIFWQTARTAKQARPVVGLPTARATGHVLQIVIDQRERYAWSFNAQQATTVKRQLPIGDYGVTANEHVVAVVERKSIADLVSSLTGGTLRYLLGELASVPRAAVVVEDRYSRIFEHAHVRGSVIADGLAELQIRYPTVPIVFAESRQLAQEWTYRFFGAAIAFASTEDASRTIEDSLPSAPALPPREPSLMEIRTWATREGFTVSPKGRVPKHITELFRQAHGFA